MRQFKRISIVLEKLDFEKYLLDIGIKIDTDVLIDMYHTRKEEIKTYWETYPDLRLTQVFVNLGILTNFPGTWYYKEEVDYMIESGMVKFEEIYFWGVNYTKENKKLPSTVFVPLKDLETDHIRNIIIYFEEKVLGGLDKLDPRYKKYFEQRIKEEGRNKTEETLKGLFNHE